MKCIIAGSRGFTDYQIAVALVDRVREFKVIDEIVSGAARGADLIGERYAQEHNLSCARFPADWDKFGKSAGFIRNKQMADYADMVIAFWDGESRDTKMMIETMINMNKPTIIYNYVTGVCTKSYD